MEETYSNSTLSESEIGAVMSRAVSLAAPFPEVAFNSETITFVPDQQILVWRESLISETEAEQSLAGAVREKAVQDLGWLALAERAFAFWDNDEDAIYDDL